MITVTRIASIAPGKTGDALAFAQHIAKYIKQNHGTTLEVLMPIGGNPSRIAWLARYDSLAQWEGLTGALMADQGYLETLAKNSATFLPGSVHDEIWRSI